LKSFPQQSPDDGFHLGNCNTCRIATPYAMATARTISPPAPFRCEVTPEGVRLVLCDDPGATTVRQPGLPRPRGTSGPRASSEEGGRFWCPCFRPSPLSTAFARLLAQASVPQGALGVIESEPFLRWRPVAEPLRGRGGLDPGKGLKLASLNSSQPCSRLCSFLE
jgi:hypothetical protein